MALPDNVRYFVADTETTGVNVDDKVVEVGWIEIDENFNIISQVESLIDPERFISPESSGIHGLVNADVENSPTIEEFFSLDDPGCYGQRQPPAFHRHLCPEPAALRWGAQGHGRRDDGLPFVPARL